MLRTRGLGWPITLGVIMILLIVAFAIIWIVGVAQFSVNVSKNPQSFWTLLAVGTVLLSLLLVGVVWYLVISVKEIRLNQRQANFVASVTHELKSPIASLKLSLQTLGRRALSDEQKQGFHRFMLDDIERLDKLINHLLAAARLEQTSPQSGEPEIAVREVLESCIHSITARYQLPTGAVTLECDPIYIRCGQLDAELLFGNLLDNAAKYAGDPAKIEVVARMRGASWASIRVTDNGRGIPLSERRRIFGRFVRLGSELERTRPGAGLGLYIVRELVRRMRGRIHVRNRFVGTGATFEVELPARQGDAPRTASSAA